MIDKQDLEYLLNQTRVKLTGATDAGIKNELFSVLDEFFDLSSSWHEKVFVNGLTNVPSYGVAPTDGQIIRLGWVVGNSTYPTIALYNTAIAANPANQGDWTPLPASLADLNTVLLANTFNSPQLLQIDLIKNVVMPTTRDMVPIAPDWVLRVYGRYILDGILGKLMAQPGKSYSNATTSVYHLKRFQDGISRARVAAMRANTYGGQAWTFPRFARSSQNRFLNVGNSRGF